ncbi:MAG: hypothetical protein HWN79_16805 [Candidatus Lokiarchaeota archaeon]|nr:hypothetical protein [Candidatus Lokiarchaeota archaeon]
MEFKILEDSLPLISKSAKNWTAFAEILKHSADDYKDECLNQINLNELRDIVLEILVLEENLFKNLAKIKI